MRVTYIDTAMSSGSSTALDASAGPDDDRVLKRILIGKPTAAGTITVYSVNNAVVGSTSNIIFKYTYPTFGSGTPASDTLSFTSAVGATKGTDGMVIPGGGSLVTSSAMQVTFLWDNPDDA